MRIRLPEKFSISSLGMICHSGKIAVIFKELQRFLLILIADRENFYDAIVNRRRCFRGHFVGQNSDSA